MTWKNDQVTETETTEILNQARACLTRNGDLVELGCYRGDTSLLLADLLNQSGADKQLWIYDSFEGLPAKTTEDDSVAGANFQAGVLAVTKREVKLRFLKAGLPVPVIKKAWFSDLTDADLPNRICFAFLDGDLYQSIKDSFKLIDGKVTDGGVIMVHDYNNPELPGVTQAVNEFLAEHNLSLEQKASLAIIRL